VSTKKKAKHTDLYDTLGELGDGISLVRVALRSLEQQAIAGDEISTLRVALDILSEAHKQFNTVADDNEPVTPRMPGIGEE
jgi:hypothetical protein